MGSLIPPKDGITATEIADRGICELAARHFQLELFELAVKQNVIICLGTGTGKTLISALLIKELLHQTESTLEKGGRRTVFLAPTVPLVQQQTNYLRRHLNARVASFVGAMRVDDWSGNQWWKEFCQHNVLVMTPTILNNILNANFICMANINLLVFDECHCATGKDPYVQIMQNHYLSTHPTIRPKILGLTASVLNKKVKSFEMISRIEELESRLGAKIVTAFSAVDYATRPREIIVKYPHGNERSLTTPHPKATAYVNDILASVGPFGCLQVIRRKIRQLNNMILSGVAAEHRLRDAKQLQKAYEAAEKTICSWEAPLEDASPKAWKLMNVLEAFKNVEQQLCGIVFTVERSTVFALCSWVNEMIKKYPERWGFLRCDFVIGQHGMTLYGPEYADSLQIPEVDSIRHQERVLRDFRTKHLNLLISTSVIEEGVDIPACNLVLRYDPPKNMRSYVQSRGRARGHPSVYVLFADVKAAPVICQDISQFKNIEFQLLRYCNAMNRIPIESSQMFMHLYNRSHLSNIHSKVHPNNCRAVITPFAARQILQWYCDSLGSDRYTLQKPDYFYETAAAPSKLVRCGIHLPRQSPLQVIVHGAWEESSLTARTSAAINVLSRLYSMGELTEHLLPRKRKVALEVSIDEVSTEVAELFKTGPATQTNLILCPRRMCSALKAQSIAEFPVTLTLYKFSLRISKLNDNDHLDTRYMDPIKEPVCMGLLVGTEISERLPEFPVYTRAGMEMVTVKLCKPVILDLSQFRACSKFNEYLFDEILKIPSMNYDERAIPVIVPILDDGIHWELIKSVTTEETRTLELTENSVVNVEATDRMPNVHEKRCYVERIFTKEDGTVMIVPKRVQKRLEMIFPRHEDRLGNVSLKTTKRKPRSLAPRPASKCVIEKLPGSVWNKATSVPSIVYRLNRLLVAEELRVAIVRATGLGRERPDKPWKPLGMERQAGHRQTQLQIENDIIRDMKFNEQPQLEDCDGPSPADILKALTPLYVTDIVDSERLEVIGDSFLKIAVTLHFYQELISSNEGELTTMRCRIISNMSLLQHAVPKGIHEMIECIKFRVRVNFVPPGSQEKAPLTGRCLKADITEMSRNSQYYKSKLCADSVEALIGVYLEKCGPVGALGFLGWLDIPLGRYDHGDFLERFELPLPDPLPDNKRDDIERWRKEIETVQETLQYVFKNELLALEAITHKSYRYNRLTRSYERLEFLGDAVIDYLISKYIYTADSDLNPGQLTDVRASLVSNNTFAAIIVDNRLHTVMQHHSPLLLKLTNRFVEYRETERRINVLDYLISDEEDLEDLEQVDIPKPLGDLMESLMGAVFLDSGKSLDTVWAVLVRLMTEEFMRDAVVNVRVNPVRQLSEMFPEAVEFSEPAINEKGRTVLKVTVLDKEFEATARNKKVAKVVLAKKALRFFQREKEKRDQVEPW